MKIQKFIFILALACGTLVCFGCDALQQALQLQKPTASLKGVSFQNISADSAELLFDVDIENPYPVDLPLVDLDYNLVSSDKPFLSGQAKLDEAIPKNGSKIVSLPVKINYIDLARAVMQFKPGVDIPYNAQVGLSVDTPGGAIRLPLSKEGTLSIPNISDLSKYNWRNLLTD